MARTSNYSGPKFANGNYKSYQREYDGQRLQIKKRAALNRENRRRGTYGNGDGRDVSHKRDGSTTLEIASKNRARVGKQRKA
ncbi:MAG: hypothetical protein CL831_00275 [Crocinitomicaceae bacterium]|jgi:hypothetical protein|nr:hypothetical protein [Paracoccaceae bacterium]MAU75292.1 hypothetical protein [Crocinitomicaceae bacterium]|tara:strand:+ start:459 stop:704 length:246 start_codon:yes stop_codon:yes gene_type:complete